MEYEFHELGVYVEIKFGLPLSGCSSYRSANKASGVNFYAKVLQTNTRCLSLGVFTVTRYVKLSSGVTVVEPLPRWSSARTSFVNERLNNTDVVLRKQSLSLKCRILNSVNLKLLSLYNSHAFMCSETFSKWLSRVQICYNR